MRRLVTFHLTSPLEAFDTERIHSVRDFYRRIADEFVPHWILHRSLDLSPVDEHGLLVVTPLPEAERCHAGDVLPEGFASIRLSALDRPPEPFIVEIRSERGETHSGGILSPPWAEIRTLSLADQSDAAVRLVCHYGFELSGAA